MNIKTFSTVPFPFTCVKRCQVTSVNSALSSVVSASWLARLSAVMAATRAAKSAGDKPVGQDGICRIKSAHVCVFGGV